MAFDSYTLFGANAVVLTVMAAAFALAARDRAETYWYSWATGNLLLAGALVIYMTDDLFSPLVEATVPNALLVLGFAVRLYGARLFNGYDARFWLWLAPPVAFTVATAYPLMNGQYGTVFTLTNLLLTGLAIACAVEFGRSRNGMLPSRIGLVISFSIIAASFGVRVIQGLLSGGAMQSSIPNDTILVIHLTIALFHTIGSGAFALSLSYERKTLVLLEAARRDPLTGLLNRGAFENDARDVLSSEAFGGRAAVVIIDLDHFKAINDLHGHAAGDRTLIACAGILREVEAQGAIVGRIGGEEFALLLVSPSPDNARRCVQSVLRRFETVNLPLADGTFISFTASAGMCHRRNDAGNLEQLMRIADDQLYLAKRNGRNRIEQIAA